MTLPVYRYRPAPHGLLTRRQLNAKGLSHTRAEVMPGHITHKNCANCLPYALNWRNRVVAGLPENSPTGTLTPI